MTTALNIDQAIVSAIRDLNGAIDYDEKEIVDEDVSELSTLILYGQERFIVDKDEDVATTKDSHSMHHLALLYLNYIHLKTNGMTADKAMMVAAVRVSILASGGYYPDDQNPSIAQHCYKPEIRIIAEPRGLFISAAREDDTKEQRTTEGDKPADTSSTATTTSTTTTRETSVITGMRVASTESDFLTRYNALDHTVVKRMAKYLPIMGHMAFTKFGHHYVNTPYFKTSYEKQFRSLQLATIEPVWNQCDIIYNAIHWMGPYTMKLWCQNLLEKKLMPRALAIKFPLIPAGTALIASTVAVLRAAGSIPGFDAFYKVYSKEWTVLNETVAKIKKDPYAHHVRYDLFDENDLESTLGEAKASAAVLAPAAQAFINKFAQGTDLARIQAIRKHAESNIGLLRRYEAIFAGNATQTRGEARTRPLRELILGTPTAMPSVAPTVDENE